MLHHHPTVFAWLSPSAFRSRLEGHFSRESGPACPSQLHRGPGSSSSISFPYCPHHLFGLHTHPCISLFNARVSTNPRPRGQMHGGSRSI